MGDKLNLSLVFGTIFLTPFLKSFAISYLLIKLYLSIRRPGRKITNYDLRYFLSDTVFVVYVSVILQSDFNSYIFFPFFVIVL